MATLWLAAGDTRLRAATITWATPRNIAGAGDVDTEGTQFGSWAPYNAGANALPVNGVTFQGWDDLGITFSGFIGGGAYFGTHTTADANYNSLLEYGIYSDGTTATVTINGDGSRPLTVGSPYLIQFWVSDARSYGLTRNESISGSSALGFQTNSGMGQYVIGRFTADATSQQLVLNANASAQINLLQVRDLTPPNTNAPTAGGVADPANLTVGQTTLVTVTVTNGVSPNITNVTLDASQLGVAAPIGLVPAAGNVFTNTVTVGAGTVYGNQILLATVTDGAGLHGQAKIPVVLPTPAPHRALPASLETWRSNRFGMFIHWGPVTLTGLEISWSRANSNPQCPNNGPTPVAVYDNLYTRFDPTNFNASNWVAIARAAGIKYMVLTAKHCDGFLLWDSKASAYNIMNSPVHRDVCRELADAAHAAGMKIGWYFSPPDWKDPRFRTSRNADFVRTMQAELRELLSNYGRIDILWFDWDGGSNVYDVTNTYAMCRSLQPDIVIDNRLDLGPGADSASPNIGPWADYYTPEQNVGGFNNQTPWETCMTIGTQWAWKPNDTIKSVPESLRILLLCAGGDGNLLYNLGPQATGEFEQRYIDVVAGVGAWLNQYGEGVYGTRGGPYQPGSDFSSTRKDTFIYLHLFPPQATLTLPALPTNIVSASVLTGGSVTFSQSPDSVELQLPPELTTNPVITVKLTLAGSAMDIPLLAPGVLSWPPTLAWSTSGTNLVLSWASNYLGWSLLTQTNGIDRGVSANTNDWAVMPGSATTNQVLVPIDLSKSARFFRLAQ